MGSNPSPHRYAPHRDIGTGHGHDAQPGAELRGEGGSGDVARVRLAIQEAERLGHNGIGCEHLLLGVLAEEDGPAARVLVAHGVTLDAARRRTDEITGDGWQDSVRWSCSPRATVVLKLAEIEAERLCQVHPSQAHRLLAMITEGEGIPMHLFKELGVDVGKVREDLLDALDVPADAREMYLRQRTAYEQARRRQRCPH